MPGKGPRKEAIADLDDVLHSFNRTMVKVDQKWSGIQHPDRVNLSARAHVTLLRRRLLSSHFRRELLLSDRKNPRYSDAELMTLRGRVQGAKEDYEAGHLSDPPTLIKAETFRDFLEMSDYLLEAKFVDPALTTAVGVLEQHMRLLATKNGVKVDQKAAVLNDSLQGGGVYRTKTDHARIQLWLTMRNSPAHGEFEEHHGSEVRIALQGIRDFIERYPLA